MVIQNCPTLAHHRTWEKLLVAVHAIVATEDSADVSVISSRNTGQQVMLKFVAARIATPISGHFNLGIFTNQIQAAFQESGLLVVINPKADHQALTEASYINLPTIALCNTDSSLYYVYMDMPCNNKRTHLVDLIWWRLTQEVTRMHGTIFWELPRKVMLISISTEILK
ncbi:hypothetical protein P7K49_038866 [Saguinus oedipus]|uniref:40S ribosomal protein SA n=1 Tax=Saguinus oedipus TaxID=9490 RepID=A0ABQ9TFV8_SAGOE|nr:hypothetical protein P7K49_038866 [Saguinus oedipus]